MSCGKENADCFVRSESHHFCMTARSAVRVLCCVEIWLSQTRPASTTVQRIAEDSRHCDRLFFFGARQTGAHEIRLQYSALLNVQA